MIDLFLLMRSGDEKIRRIGFIKDQSHLKTNNQKNRLYYMEKSKCYVR